MRWSPISTSASVWKPTPTRNSDRLVDDRVGQRADLFDLDADTVAGLEPDGRVAREAHAVGRAGEDDRAGEQGFAGAEILDDGRHIEDHVVGVPVLHDGAVEDRLDAKLVRVGDLIPGHQHRPERAERVEALALAPLAA